MLFITTAIYVDKDGTRYGSRIAPDERIEGGLQYAKDLDVENDPVIAAAMEWMTTFGN